MNRGYLKMGSYHAFLAKKAKKGKKIFFPGPCWTFEFYEKMKIKIFMPDELQTLFIFIYIFIIFIYILYYLRYYIIYTIKQSIKKKKKKNKK